MMSLLSRIGKYWPISVLLVAAIILLLWLNFPGKKPLEPNKSQPPLEPERKCGFSASLTVPLIKKQPGAIKPPMQVSNPAEIIEGIRTSVTRYDKEALRTIARHLNDSDPEVRAAACDGLVQLADEEAAPLLEQQAAQTSDPKEAVKLQEAAEFLRLPSVTISEMADLVQKNKRAKESDVSPSPEVPNSYDGVNKAD